MSKRIRRAVLLASLSNTLFAVPIAAQTRPPSAEFSSIGSADPFGISIQAEEFTLPNGLRVIVHTDHTTPIVSVNIWYKVASRNEVAGKTGFAHLFEHLMFQGSENYRDDYLRPFELVGTSGLNGSTSFDRTNYYETVPTPALDMALWMESDRMGHFLGAIDQKTLDEQRGVVQNEKRQRYGQPYGLVNDRLYQAIFPERHPYHHQPIGSMADLDAANVDDVKAWFKSWYGPNNAILVLAGDIDLATAKEKVTKYFGDIAPSATVAPMKPDVPRLSKVTREVFPDRVPQNAIYRAWPVAADGDPDLMPLQMLAYILGGSGASRLNTRLVEKEQVATNAAAVSEGMELAGVLLIATSLKDGVEAPRVESMIDEEIKRLIQEGPTAQEVEQARAALSSQYINALPRVFVRANVLAQCAGLRGRPDCWRDDMRAVANATPASLKAVAGRWLNGGSHSIEVKKSDVAAASLPEPSEPALVRKPMLVPKPDVRFRALPGIIDRSAGVPKVTGYPEFKLPPLQRATLSNGVEVVLTERHSAPVVTIVMSFPSASTVRDRLAGAPAGRGTVAMQMLSKGAGEYSASQLASRLETLGGSVLPTASRDGGLIVISLLKNNMAATLDLAADMLLRPTFATSELGRYRGQLIASIEQTKSNASKATGRLIAPLLYGEGHPYNELLTEEAVRRLTREDLTGFMRDRLDARGARIIVAGDTTLAEVLPLLEARFGNIQRKEADADTIIPDAPLPSKPRIFLIDQPGVPQATIRAAQLVGPQENSMESDALDVGNAALGSGFTSRLNMDLREDKHWSYGAGSSISAGQKGQRSWSASAAVQVDRTADSLKAMLDQIAQIDSKSAPITIGEVEKSRAGLLGLPGTFETGTTLAFAIYGMVARGWPDDYYQQHISRVGTMRPEQATEAFAKAIQPNSLTWVVMGPLDKIEAPIRALGIGDVFVIDADGKPVKRN